jgi:hypothetical protein
MRSIVHKFILASVVMAAAALATNTAMAEGVLIKVPFNFIVAGKNCPAGLYSVQRDSASHILFLQSRTQPQIFGWVAGPGAPEPNDGRVRLKFTEDGMTHTLQSVQYRSLITARLDKHTPHSEHSRETIIEQ